MCFKGTKRRPDASALSRDLDSVGADYNAFTNKDHTGYYVKLSSDRLDLASDMLEDMVYHSLYRPQDIESEKGVIVEELRMYEDNPMMRVDELLEEELYGGSTLGCRGASVELWASDVAAVVVACGMARPAVAGLSMGGHAALAVAAIHPGLARGFGFLNHSAPADDEEGRLREGGQPRRVQDRAAAAAAVAAADELGLLRPHGKP